MKTSRANMATAYSNLAGCIAFFPKVPSTAHFPPFPFRSRTCGFDGISVSTSRCQVKFEKFQENIKDDDLQQLLIQEPNDAEEEDDSCLPSDLEGAVQQSGLASAEFVSSGGTRAILQFLDDEGAQIELWELSKIFLDTLMEETRCQRVKAIFPDAGAAALLKYKWKDPKFGFSRISVKCPSTFIINEHRHLEAEYKWRGKDSSIESSEKWKRDNLFIDRRDSIFIDQRGKLRSFNHKKVSRKKGGSLRGQGWKFGSGFVDGIFPVLSPIGQQILNFVQKNISIDRIWSSLGNLPPTNTTWDDLINVVVRLRLNKQWDPIILICEWITRKSSFKPDVICYNLLIEAYGHKLHFKKAESTYAELLEARCIPTEDTYALLLKVYCKCGFFDRAEAIFIEMQKNGLPPSTIAYNSYIDGLIKGKNSQQAIAIFKRMKRENCELAAETYTMMINLYGKENKSYMALEVFREMRSKKCEPNICTYTALVNALARDGLCEKAEEIFEQLQEAGHEPDVYAYNALMEAYSRAGFPLGAAEIFALMHQMGCEPDRASYNIMIDAYGRSGLHGGAQAVFDEMIRLEIEPTMKSFTLLLSAYSRMGNSSKCEEIVNHMHKFGLTPDTFILNTMLNLYGRLGYFEKMEHVLSAMENGACRPDISTFNILINIYGRAGFLEKMEELFMSLSYKNLRPDVVTWTSRLGAYSRMKQYTRCIEIFEEMIDSGCYPDGGTAKVLLSSCSSEDQIEQVTAVIRTMHKADKKTV